AGQLLLSHATRMLQLQREAIQAMDSFQGRLAGELHVAASTIPGEYILPALIGRFKEKFPDIAITLLIGDSRAVVDWVVDGRAEVAMVGARLPHRSEEHTSELQSLTNLVCRLLLEKKKNTRKDAYINEHEPTTALKYKAEAT